MSRSFRFVLAAAVLALTAALLTACGGGGGSSSAGDLLKSTFSGGHTVKSGNLAVDLRLDTKGLKSLSGPVELKLNGPFQSLGKGKLPEFDLDLGLTTNGSTFSAGAISTGDRGWLKLQGTNFAITPQLFAQFKSGYEQQAGKSKSGQPSFSSLGINPLSWLKDPKTVGTESVGGADTYHISAGVDVARLLGDVSTLLSKASALSGATGARLPSSLSAQQRQDIAQSVQSASLDVWTGKDDKTLRRLSLKIGIDVPPSVRPRANGLTTGTLSFDLTIADLNQSQQIAAPKSSRPLSDLQSLLSGGAASGSGSTGTGTTGTGSTGTGSTGTGTSSSKYLTCLQKAGSDVAKIQQCASLVGQ